jgi:hypothetical protein
MAARASGVASTPRNNCAGSPGTTRNAKKTTVLTTKSTGIK